MLNLVAQPSAIMIPEDVGCIPSWVLASTVGVSYAIIGYLIKDRKRVEQRYLDSVAEHRDDLKKHTECIHKIADTKTNLTLANLGKQLTRLETSTASLEKIFDAVLHTLNKK